MLNAKARSKAKLPICAMREIPNVFFQKARRQATRAVGYGGRQRRGQGTRRESPSRSDCRVSLTHSPLSRKSGETGGTHYRAPVLDHSRATWISANVTRSAGGSAGESRARRPASLRLRG